jgi:hypothetical protein
MSFKDYVVIADQFSNEEVETNKQRQAVCHRIDQSGFFVGSIPTLLYILQSRDGRMQIR